LEEGDENERAAINGEEPTHRMKKEEKVRETQSAKPKEKAAPVKLSPRRTFPRTTVSLKYFYNC